MKEMMIIIKNLLTKSFKVSFQHHIILLLYQTTNASNPPKQSSNLQSKTCEITEHNGRARWEHRFPFELQLMKVGQRKGEEEEGEFGLGKRR